MSHFALHLDINQKQHSDLIMVLDERSEDPQSYKNHPDGEHECTTFHANPSDSCRELLLNNLNFTLREKSVWIKVGD